MLLHAVNCTPAGAHHGFDEEIRDVCIALANGLAESANKGELMQSSKVEKLEVRRELVRLAASVCAVSMQRDVGGKDGTCFPPLQSASSAQSSQQELVIGVAICIELKCSKLVIDRRQTETWQLLYTVAFHSISGLHQHYLVVCFQLMLC